jgi:hypothetical protein
MEMLKRLFKRKEQADVVTCPECGEVQSKDHTCPCFPQPPAEYEVPKEYVKRLLELADRSQQTQTRMAMYELFDEIERLFPFTKEGSWTIKQTGRHLYLVEVKAQKR